MATGNIIGKVNVPISPIKYTGEETLTAITNVDNDRKVISVDVKVEEVVKDCATKEELAELHEYVDQQDESLSEAIGNEVSRATEAEETLDSKKLDKSNTSNTLYGKDAQGNESNIYYSSDFNDKAGHAVIRDEHSDVLVPTTPSSNNGATSKSYVDAFGKLLAMSLDSSYNLTINLKDANNNVISTQTVDLPLESIVTSATYYETYTYEGVTYTKVIVITLETTDVPTIIPVGDLVRGLVSDTRTVNGHPLSSDVTVTKEDVGLGNVDNKSEATIKSDFTGSVASGDTGFVTGGDVYNSIEGVSDSLGAAIQAETSRAEQAEGSLSDEIDETKTHYFANIVAGEHVDSQVGHTKSWCYDGSMVVGGETPSTTIIRFTQTSNKALYIKSIAVDYTQDGEEHHYTYSFDSKVFTENNQSVDLGGLTWLLSDTNDITYFAYSNSYGQQIGSGTKGIRNCSLTTTGLAGCTVTRVAVEATGASSTNCKVAVEVAGDTWIYHEGESDESTIYALSANELTTAPFTFGEGSTPGAGTIITFHNVFLEKNDNEEVVSSEAATETLYVNKDNYLFYMWDGSDFFIISKTLTLGQTSTTAYRGDWGSQNHSDILSLQNVKLNKDNFGEVIANNIYDNTSTYAIGDVAYYGSYLYKCITTVTEPEDFDANKWAAITVESLINKDQVGLGNVDNTSDLNKPISTATQTALDGKQDILTFDSEPTENSTNPVTSGGIKTYVDTNGGKIDKIKIDGVEQTIAEDKSVNIDLSGKQNTIDSSHKLSSDLVDDTNHTHKFVSASEKTQITTNATNISNHTGNTSNPHSVTKSQVGLGNVDNTSDATKKTNFTGSIAENNTGFVTGGDAYTALNDRLTYEEALLILTGTPPVVIDFAGTYNYSVGGTIYTSLVLNADNTGTYTYGSDTMNVTYTADEESVTLTKVSGSVSNYDIFLNGETTATSVEIVISDNTCNTIKLKVKGRVTTSTQSFIRAA